jgi:hypothetical protein
MMAFSILMFGTTEEVFFANWDFGGAGKDNAIAQKHIPH